MHTEILTTVLCFLGQLLQAPASSDTVSESVEIRYARAQVQLAEANLKRVERSNKRLAGSVPSSVVADINTTSRSRKHDSIKPGRSGRK